MDAPLLQDEKLEDFSNMPDVSDWRQFYAFAHVKPLSYVLSFVCLKILKRLHKAGQ